MQDDCVVVVNSGSFSVKVGWSANRLPSVDLTQFAGLGVERSAPYAADLLDAAAQSLAVREAAWTLALGTRLGSSFDCSSYNYAFPVALTDSRVLSRSERAEAAEFFFETLRVPALSIVPEDVATLRALRTVPLMDSTDPLPPLLSGVIVNVGYESTRLCASHANCVAARTRRKVPWGGRDACQEILHYLHPSSDENTSLETPTTTLRQRGSTALHHGCCRRLAHLLFRVGASYSLQPDLDRYRLAKRETEGPSAVRSPAAAAVLLGLWSSCCLGANGRLDAQPPLTARPKLQPRKSTPGKNAGGGNAGNSSSDEQQDNAAAGKMNSLARIPTAGATGKWNTHQCCICSCPQFTHELSELKDAINPGFRQLAVQAGSDWGSVPSKSSMQLMDKERIYDCGAHPYSVCAVHGMLDLLSDGVALSARKLDRPYCKRLRLNGLEAPMFNACESIFRPAPHARPGSNGRSHLADVIATLCSESPLDYKRTMFNNILVVGALCSAPHFTERLEQEITNAIQSRRLFSSAVNIRVRTCADRDQNVHSSWIGVRNSLGVENGVTLAEFLETGRFDPPPRLGTEYDDAGVYSSVAATSST